MAAPGAPASPNASRVDRRFDVLRNKVEQEAGAVQQKAQEGLARKAVSQGAQGSGAFIKLGQQQDKELATQKQNAVMDVESQREAAQAQADEVQANRDFAKGEREAGQTFASQQREAGQSFAAQQALLGREFESGEAGKNRTFQSKEAAMARGFSEKLFDKDLDFKKKVQKVSESQFGKQFNQMLKQFDYDKVVGDFNMDMATKQFNKKSMTESLIGGGAAGSFAGNTVGRWTGKDSSNLGAGFGGGGF